MDTAQLKLILMLLLCLPVLVAGFIIFFRTDKEEKNSVVVKPVRKERRR